MRKLASIILLVLLPSLLLCSCYDRKELEEYGYILAIGLDRGTRDILRITLQLSSFKVDGGTERGGGGGTTEKDIEKREIDGSIIASVEAPSFFTGLDMISAGFSRQINLMHTKFLVFSEELARDGEIETYIAPILRYRQTRGTMIMMTARGSAEEFIMENRILSGNNPAKSMELTMEQISLTGFAPQTNLSTFYSDAKSGYRQPITPLVGVNKGNGEKNGEREASGGEYTAGDIPRTGALKREIFGSAIFKGYKMIGQLDGDDTRLLLMGRGEFKKGFFTIKDPKKPNLFALLDVTMEGQPRIKVDVSGEKPKIDMFLDLEGNIVSIQSGIYYESTELKPILEKAFADNIQKSLENLIKKSQEKYDSDILGLGRAVAGKFLTIEDWQEYNWNKRYSQADITTNVDFKIRRTGTIQKTSKELSKEE